MAPAREKKVASDACRVGVEVRAGQGLATVRRVSGPAADEMYVLCRAEAGTAEAGRQAEAAYRAMGAVFGAEGLTPDTIFSETVFFRRIRQDYGAVREVRSRMLGEVGGVSCTAPVTFIEQAPLGNGDQVQIAAVAVVPRTPDAFASVDLHRVLSCPCPACKPGARARIVRVGGESHLRAANICGTGRGGFDQAYDMFQVASQLLREAGMTFHDVIRTWIYLRDIDRDYDALNEARRAFFKESGVERRPASTGVQGAPFSDAHDFSMTLYALKASQPIEVALMSTPTLNEAWTYGADFSRGLRVVDANKVALYISGTASINEAGESVHVGDLAAQVDRMLYNIEALLAAQGATFKDVVSAVTYLKRPSDAPVLRDMFRSRGFDGFPCALVEAPLCRPELLCETEAVAVLPLPAARV
jgi:enamine deaminase RidA (YjgF/YER057c/UK114 family)